MDIGAIGASALYGAIGGGLGGLLGALLGAPFRNRAVTTVLVVLFAAIGYNVARPLLSPHIGPLIGDTPEARIERASPRLDETMAELREDAVFAALIEKEPGFEAEYRARLAAIIGETTDPREARNKAFALSYEAVEARLTSYVQRGEGEAILAYLDATLEVMDHLAATDPVFCHAYLYDAQQLAEMEMPELKTRIGPDRFARQQASVATLIRTAFDAIPPYDEHLAQLQINMAGQYLYQTLGDDRIGMVTAGQKPANEDDARAVCEASAGMMRLIRDGDEPADTFRHLMVLNGQGQ